MKHCGFYIAAIPVLTWNEVVAYYIQAQDKMLKKF